MSKYKVEITKKSSDLFWAVLYERDWFLFVPGWKIIVGEYGTTEEESKKNVISAHKRKELEKKNKTTINLDSLE